MEARTITDEAKRDLIHVLNESLEIEYDMILNYPRMIEKLENIDKIHDEQLNYDLQLLGRQSIRHFNEVDSLVTKLGGQPVLKFGVIERMADVQEMLEQQLGKEKTAMSLYQDGRQLVQKSTIKVKAKNILDRLVRYVNGLPEDVVTTNEINIVLERHESEELRHIKICEDCIATLKMLRGKKS